MRLIATLTVAAAIAAFASAQPPADPDVTVLPRPAAGKSIELKAEKGQVVTLSAGKAKAARWLLMDTANADLAPNNLTAAFTAAVDGKYRVVAAIDGELVLIVLTIGKATPQPPDPLPVPDTPLAKSLRAAFDADADPLKRERAKDLAALYRQAATLAGNADVATSGELLRRVRDASTTLIGPDALVPVRKIVAAELAVLMGEDAELTAETRKSVAKLFRDVAAAIDGF